MSYEMSELEHMARNCSSELFAAVTAMNLTSNASLMRRLYDLCPLVGDTNDANHLVLVDILPALSVYVLTFVLGVAGNALIVAAVFGYRKMKSPTNIFLASLAVADLLFCLICIPVKVSKF